MADNNKFSIDLSMSNGTEQIKNYKAAFDELRNSQNRSASDTLGGS